MAWRRDDLLSAARERTFLTAAAGFAVGYAFVAFVGALLNTIVAEMDDTPGRWTFVLTSLVVLVVVATAGLVALAWRAAAGAPPEPSHTNGGRADPWSRPARLYG